MSKVIDLNNTESLQQLSKEITQNIQSEILSQRIKEASSVLSETVDFTPSEALEILNILGINSSQSPQEMNKTIHNSNEAFILRKKFFDTSITQSKIEGALVEVISEMSRFISGNVIQAIIDLVKSIIKICAFEKVMTEYNELSFRFFTKADDDVVILLIVNVKFDERAENFSLLQKTLNYLFNRVHICFFASVVKTSFQRTIDGQKIDHTEVLA